MATEPDPYRTLGLDPTATVDQIRRAYRQLAKANHPDAAGEAALPRFLAIQAAYERLVGPTPGRGRTPSGASAASPRKPWEADSDRTDATRRAYGGRARRSAGEGARKSGGGSKPGASKGPGASRPGGSSGPAASETAGTGRSGRGTKKATLGSTSYDGVDREAFEPDWVGGSWYGTTSGTYWTINPKEYADPRKHGPEYQARARRSARGDEPPGVDPPPPEPIGVDPPTEAPGAPGTAGPPRHTTSSWWEATSGPAAPPRGPAPPPPRSAPPPPSAPRPASRPSPSSSDGSAGPRGLSDLHGALVTDARPTAAWRIARAVIGWLPIGLAIGWASGELTGCGRFSATCDTSTAPVVWVLQALAFAVLLALPRVAGWTVVGTLTCLIVAVPTTLFVTATAGAAAAESGTAFLGTVLVLAWFAGTIGAVVVGRRSLSGRRTPVS